jgi:acetylglutamate kinase
LIRTYSYDKSQPYADDIAQLKQQDLHPIIIHGGGPFINQALEQQGVDSGFTFPINI